MKHPHRFSRKHMLQISAGMLASVVALYTIPFAWCSRGAARWLDGDREVQIKLARGVERLVFDQQLSSKDFRTGFDLYDGEWLFGSYLMAGIGFTQVVMEHPDLKDEMEPLARKAIEKLLRDDVRAFDQQLWRADPLASFAGDNHHAAYLGYLNLLLGLYRKTFGEAHFDDLHNQITAKFVRHLSGNPLGLLESYPGEVYPVDNCFVIGSIGLHQSVTGTDHQELLAQLSVQIRDKYVDADTGLLIQAVDPYYGRPIDVARGSGTVLGLIALHYADPVLAHDLYLAMKSHLASHLFRFGGVREYPFGQSGRMDIDSGPIVFGFGLSSTGFAIAGARRYDDRAFFRGLFATAHLCGAPVGWGGRRAYISGGPLGNAILFAMLTSPRVNLSEWEILP